MTGVQTCALPIFQAKLGSLAKAGTKGKKRSSSLKNIALPISNKQRRVEGLHPISLILLLPLMTMTLILLLTKMMMIMLSLLVFQIIPFYLRKHCKVTLLTMMTTKKMTATTIITMMMPVILEWNIMQLFMMEEKTLLLLSIKPDYQPVLALQMLLKVYLLIFPLFLGMD